MMSCDEFTSLVTEYLDGRVPHGKKIGMWMHRLMCVRCRNYLRQMQEILDFVGTYDEAPEAPLDQGTRRELLDRFKERHGPGCGCDHDH